MCDVLICGCFGEINDDDDNTLMLRKSCQWRYTFLSDKLSTKSGLFVSQSIQYRTGLLTAKSQAAPALVRLRLAVRPSDVIGFASVDSFRTATVCQNNNNARLCCCSADTGPYHHNGASCCSWLHDRMAISAEIHTSVPGTQRSDQTVQRSRVEAATMKPEAEPRLMLIFSNTGKTRLVSIACVVRHDDCLDKK